MTAINTNTAALNAQYFLAKSNKDMESSMAKLSSGQKVNSAADDAAGLAIASRMTAQIRGLAMAVKNSNDSMSLAQTAEGAMEEVTNMLQRIRELAVQSANGTMNSGDRSSLDAEVQALKAEIDRVATTTTFNSQNLLDGSYKATFQIGDKNGQTVGLKIGSVKTDSLGLGEGSSGSNTMVSARIPTTAAITGTFNVSLKAAVDAGDITVNGQALGAIATSDDMEDIIKNIHDNVDNVKASGFNVVTAKTQGNGITADNDLQIRVAALGVPAASATTYKISASNSMEELVANINAEVNGAVQASMNDDGKLVLSNDTGATIQVIDDGATDGAYDGGSGFYGENDFDPDPNGTNADAISSKFTFGGFLQLESTDGSVVRIESGNAALASPGSSADVAQLGFNVTFQQDENDGYTVKGTALTAPGTTIAKGDLVINGVEMFNADIDTDSFKGKLDMINAFSQETGVVASAAFEQNFAITESEIVEGDVYFLNGTKLTIGGTTTVAGVATLINAKSDEIGLEATVNGKNLVLKGDNVQSLTINNETLDDKTEAITGTKEIKGAGQTDNAVIDIRDADVKEGRKFTLKIIGGGTANANTAAGGVSYTAVSGDAGEDVAKGLRAALRAAGLAGYDGANTDTVAIAANAGGNGHKMTFNNDGAKLNNGNATYTITRADDNDLFRTAQTSGTESTTYGMIKLDSVNNTPIKIDVGDQETNAAATHGFIESNVGSADFDVNEPTLSAAGGKSMSGLSVTSASAANSALDTIDVAIDTVNSIRGDLGALQNRLEYTINNLSSISNATTGARGRILDADFAKETSELTKHQILTQAATSMLAQANQSKQGILALLQG